MEVVIWVFLLPVVTLGSFILFALLVKYVPRPGGSAEPKRAGHGFEVALRKDEAGR